MEECAFIYTKDEGFDLWLLERIPKVRGFSPLSQLALTNRLFGGGLDKVLSNLIVVLPSPEADESQ